MPSIESRLAKLEQDARNTNVTGRPPGIPDEAMQTIRQVALTCGTAEELADYLKTLDEGSGELVVSLERRRQSDAARMGFARSVFEEVRG